MLLIEKQWEQRRVAAQRPHFSLLTRRCSMLKTFMHSMQCWVLRWSLANASPQ